MGGKEDRQALLEQLRQEVLQAADTYLPDGYKITLQFRDIDMAGEFEPQHGPALDDVRIIRPIYPPRLQVAYEVTNQQGDIVSRGQRRISDLAFDQIVSFRRDEPMFYVGELVRDLFRDVTRTLAG